jgi:cell division protease FtsH
LIFGKDNITTGAGNDIQQATTMARKMVTEYGFSDKLGRLRYTDNEEEVFLGHSVARAKNISDATAALIDDEVRRLIEEAEGEAHKILKKYSGELETIAQALLEYETLSGDDVTTLLKGESISRNDDGDTKPEGGSRTSVPSSGSVKKKDKGSSGIGGAEPQTES